MRFVARSNGDSALTPLTIATALNYETVGPSGRARLIFARNQMGFALPISGYLENLELIGDTAEGTRLGRRSDAVFPQ